MGALPAAFTEDVGLPHPPRLNRTRPQGHSLPHPLPASPWAQAQDKAQASGIGAGRGARCQVGGEGWRKKDVREPWEGLG